MQEKISEKDLERISFYFDPVALMETLIPKNLKAPHTWSFEDEGITVYPYEFAVLDYSYMYADDPELSDKENFQRKIGAGNCYNIGARAIGKSYIEQCNDFFTLIHGEADESCHSSFDAKNLRKVVTPVANIAKYHPFFEMFKRKGQDKSVRWTGGGLEIDTLLGHTFYGKNEKVDSDEPGTDYHSLHVKKLAIEEFSYASAEGKEKRIDAVSPLGCIERFSGIPDVRKGSPLGDLLLDDSKKNWICRLPQMVMETWDEASKERAIKEYGGEQHFQYKLNILAESIEGAFGRWDMKRIRKLCYTKSDKKVKIFEFGRDDIAHLDSCESFDEKTQKIYELLDKNIIIDIVPSEMTIIASDIGTTGTPSQVCIFFGNEQKFKWRYLISLFRLTTQEQARVFKWIYDKLDGAFISLDCSVHPDEYVLVRVDGNIRSLTFKELDNFIFKSLEVPTFKNNILEWKPAKLIKHQYKGKIGKIKTYPGNYNVRVTDNHSVMIYTPEGLQKKQLKDCKVGDWLLAPKNFNIDNQENIILSYIEPKKNHHTKDSYKDIKLDEDLAYLLGWCCAEGSSQTTNYQLTLGNEKFYAEKLLRLSQKLFNLKSGSIYIKTPEWHNSKSYNTKHANVDTYHVKFGGGKGILNFIENLVGKGCRNKKIPYQIFNSSKSVQESFLKGLIEGDGCRYDTAENTERYYLSTTSKQLANDTIVLLQMLGKFPSLNDKQKYNSYEVFWTENQKTNKWIGIPHKILGIADKKNRTNCKTSSENYIRTHGGNDSTMDNFNSIFNGDWVFKKIQKIDYEDYQGDVYDLEVEDNHTFVAGIGNLLVHNTNSDGRSIADELEILKVPRERITRVIMHEKIKVGFMDDKNGQVQTEKNGEPIFKQEITIDWACSELDKIFYNSLIEIPHSDLFLKEFPAYFATKIGNGYKYGSSTTDHLVASFLCFAICRFYNINQNLLEILPQSDFIGGF